MSSSRSHLAIINRSRFPTVETNHHETAAAEVARRRVCHCQREGYSNSSIDSVTTTLHDVDSDMRRDFVCRRDDSMSGAHRLTSSSERSNGRVENDEQNRK